MKNKEFECVICGHDWQTQAQHFEYPHETVYSYNIAVAFVSTGPPLETSWSICAGCNCAKYINTAHNINIEGTLTRANSHYEIISQDKAHHVLFSPHSLEVIYE